MINADIIADTLRTQRLSRGGRTLLNGDIDQLAARIADALNSTNAATEEAGGDPGASLGSSSRACEPLSDHYDALGMVVSCADVNEAMTSARGLLHDADAELTRLRAELESARIVCTLYAWTGSAQESKRELALFQAWQDYATTYGTPKPTPEWNQLVADLADRRRARKAEVAKRLSKIVTTEAAAVLAPGEVA